MDYQAWVDPFIDDGMLDEESCGVPDQRVNAQPCLTPVSYQWEGLASLLDDGLEVLLRKQYEEVALNKDDVPLNPDWDYYLELEKMGRWRAFSARQNGKLIGYIAWFIHYSPHYKSTLYADCDVFFVDPNHRNGLTGVRLFKEAEKALPKPCKVQISEKIHIKIGKRHGSVGDILKILGYRQVEIVHAKMLKE